MHRPASTTLVGPSGTLAACYKADHIEGRSIPLDQLTVAMDVVDGAITLHPVSFKVGTGDISGDIAITPLSDKRTHLKATIDFNRVDVARLMAATHLVTGAGSIGGKAEIDSTGNSIASWAADGNGGLTLTMAGGNLSAVLVSLSGLEFGNALIAALGVPQQTSVRCFAGDWALRSEIGDTRTLMLDTGVAIVRGGFTEANEVCDGSVKNLGQATCPCRADWPG